MSAKLSLYGQFKWEFASGEIALHLREKTKALIAYVALSGSGVVRRQQIANMLWEGGRAPMASLRQSIREIKEIEQKVGSELFIVDSQYISLDLNKLWVDARIASQCAGRYNVALAEQLVDGQPQRLLNDCQVEEESFQEWLVAERSRRNGELGKCVERLLEDATLRPDNLAEIKRVATCIFGFDPTNERAHRALISAYAEKGDRATALLQFDTCEEVIATELGAEPSEETLKLVERIKNRDQNHVSVKMLPSSDRSIISQDLRPVIVVQEFIVAGQDQVQSFLAKSFRSDIISQLSCNNRFSVKDGPTISTDVIGGSGQFHRSIYKIRGNILSIGDTFTILMQVVEENSGDIVWMKRITPHMSDILSGIDEQAVLAAIEVYRLIELKETDIARKMEEGMLTARQCLLRAVSIMFKFSHQAILEAERYLERALVQDPGYSEAYAWLAFLRSIQIGQGFATDPQATKEETGELVRKSIELSPGSDIGLAIAGHLEAFVYHDFGTAMEYFDQSHAANPNCAHAWGFSAITHCYVGKSDKALELLRRCRQIMPFDPHPYYFDTARCIASMLSGKYEDAVRIGRQVLRNNPNFHANYRPLISSLGHLGRKEEAEPVLADFEQFQPDFSVSWHLSNYPPLDDEITQRYVDGLRLAGVPD
jgi:DNA-binding SARP family transcriptional activator